MKILTYKKEIIIGLISFIITFSALSIAYGYDKSDSWNIGGGWIWIKKATDNIIRANVEIPYDGENIANKDFVMSAMAGGSSTDGGKLTCASYSCGNLSSGQCGAVCCFVGVSNTTCSVYKGGTWTTNITLGP